MEDKLTGAFQENVLTLLCFDDEFCKLVRNTVTASLFESIVFRDIASHAISFVDQFQVAPKEHIADLLEHILKGEDKRKATLYSQVLQNLYQAREGMNREYVIHKIQQFVRMQNLKMGVLDVVDQLKAGRVEEAEVILEKALKNRALTFDVGTLFADPLQSLRFLDTIDVSQLTGIKPFDDRGVGPRLGEMFLIMAPAKRGKSWGLIHMGKMGVLHRVPTVHISLEMSEERVAQRYIQSFFAVSNRDSKVKIPSFRYDREGRFLDVEIAEDVRKSLRDSGIHGMLTTMLQRRFANRVPLIIKRFPTGQLTLSGYQAYLDSLERIHKMVPKQVILDYPDLMKVSSDNRRIDTGVLMQDLRGIAVERNHALVTATQGNRASADASTVTDTHAAEDYSKIMTADTVITYSQTPQEKKLGLARLLVSNARNESDKFMVLIAQNYAIGQFCLEATMMADSYWDVLKRMSGVPPEDDSKD